MKNTIKHCLITLVLILASVVAKADVFTLDVQTESFMKTPTQEDGFPSAPVAPEGDVLLTLPNRQEASLKEEVVTEIRPIEEFRALLTKTCSVRSKPTDNSVPVKVLPKGAEVAVAPFNKEWRKIGEAYLAGTCLR